MKVIELLLEHKGENAPTPREPIGEWKGQVNLSEKVYRCINWDFDALIEVNRYEVITVEVPEWITIEDILNIKFMTSYKYYQAFGGNVNFGKKTIEAIMMMPLPEQKLSAIQLLNTKSFKSDFRKSLYDQLIRWIDTDEKKYNCPFTFKQWECLLNQRIKWDAEKRSAAAYRDRSLPFQIIKKEPATR